MKTKLLVLLLVLMIPVLLFAQYELRSWTLASGGPAEPSGGDYQMVDNIFGQLSIVHISGASVYETQHGFLYPFGNWVSGFVYTDDDELVPVGSKLVSLVINGEWQSSTLTASDGSYSLFGYFQFGDDLTVHLDTGDPSFYSGAAYTIALNDSLAGFNIYLDHLVVRSRGGDATIAGIGHWDGEDDFDIAYAVGDADGNLDLPSGYELYCEGDFVPGDTVFMGSLEIASAGSFTAGNFFHYVNGDHWMNYGTFTCGTSTIEFDASSGTKTITNGGDPFYDLRITDNATWESLDDMTISGSILAIDAGKLKLSPGITLTLYSGVDVTVASGGAFEAIGSSGNEITVTSPVSYSFTVDGTIGAEYTTFEYMNVNGINVTSTGLVDETYSFNHCIFDIGMPGGTYLIINNSQVLTVDYADFPHVLGFGGSNVTKTIDAGLVTFTNESGVFSGEDYDNDVGDSPTSEGRLIWSSTYDITVVNSFGSGTVRVDGIDYPSGTVFYWGPFSTHILTAIDCQDQANRHSEAYSRWEDNGGSTIAVYPVLTANIAALGFGATPLTYTAVFTQLVADAGIDQIICTGFGTTLGGAPTATGDPNRASYTYSWTPVDDLDDPASANPWADPTVTTEYIVSVTDDGGCEAVDTMILTVYDVDAAITSDPPGLIVCYLSDLQLYSNPSGGSGVYADFEWTGPGAAFLNNDAIEDPIFSATGDPGTEEDVYQLIVTVTDDFGCIAVDTVDITVKPLPTVAVVPDPAEVCAGEDLILDAVPGIGDPPFDFEWTGDTGPLSSTTVQNPTFNTRAPGIYTLYVQIWDVNGCSGWDSTISVTVFAIPTADAGTDENYYYGEDAVQIGGDPTASGGVGPYVYDWEPDAGLDDPAIANPYASPEHTTEYLVEVSDAHDCGSTLDTVIVSVYYKLTVQVDGLPSGIAASVATGGGSGTAEDGTPYEEWFLDGTSTGEVYVDSVIDNSDDASIPVGTRYVFVDWEGEPTETDPHTPITMDTPPGVTLEANYTTQYYINLVSVSDDPDDDVVPDDYLNDEGWYDAGSAVEIWTNLHYVVTPLQERYEFTDYDTGGTGDPDIFDTSFTFTALDGPKTVTGNWKHQYYLLVISEYLGTDVGIHTPSGWHDEGTVLELFNSLTDSNSVVDGYVARTWLDFNRWEGTGSIHYAGTDTASNITINSYITQTAYWDLYKYELIVICGEPTATPNPPVGTTWYDPDAYVHLFSGESPPPECNGWWGEGCIPTVGEDPDVWVTIDEPGIITWTFGETVPLVEINWNALGGNRTTICAAGSEVTASVAAIVETGIPGFDDVRYVNTGWTNNMGSVPADENDNSVTFTINVPSAMTWTWQKQYYLHVSVTPVGATITGDGWYDAGTDANPTCNYVWNLTADEVRQNLYSRIVSIFNGAGPGISPTTTYVPRSNVGDYNYTQTMDTSYALGFYGITQYHITLADDPDVGGTVAHSGSQTSDNWYDTGTNATLTATPIAGTENTRTWFKNWDHDDDPIPAVPATWPNFTNPVDVRMDDHYEITAYWQQQFKIVFKAKAENVDEYSWVDGVEYPWADSLKVGVTYNSGHESFDIVDEAGEEIWVYEGSTYTYNEYATYSGSIPLLRWERNDGEGTGNITTFGTIEIKYWQQYKPTIDIFYDGVSGAGGGHVEIVDYYRKGVDISGSEPVLVDGDRWSKWTDAGSILKFPQTTSGVMNVWWTTSLRTWNPFDKAVDADIIYQEPREATLEATLVLWRNYRLMGVPLVPTETLDPPRSPSEGYEKGDPDLVLHDDFFDDCISDDGGHWDMYENWWRLNRYYPQELMAYKRYLGPVDPNSCDDFFPGLGYWIVQTHCDEVEISITGVKASEPFEIPLGRWNGAYEPGQYNMCANPFYLDDPSSEPDVRIAEFDVIHYEWDGSEWAVVETVSVPTAVSNEWLGGWANVYRGGMYAQLDISVADDGSAPGRTWIDEWEGFWVTVKMDGMYDSWPTVHTIGDDSLSLLCNIHSGARRLAREDNSENWNIQFELASLDKRFRDADVKAGWYEDASNGLDHRDCEKLPDFCYPEKDYVKVYLERGGREYAYDYQAGEGIKYDWVMIVQANGDLASNTKYELNWNTFNIPAGATAILQDPIEGMTIDLDQTKNYSFTMDGNIREFYISVTFDMAMAKELLSAKVPAQYFLGYGEPNPFNSSTRIGYGISSEYGDQQVTIKIYDILGKNVRTLIDEIKTPGYYEAVWDGRDDKGEELPSGIYMYEFSSAPFSQVKKLIFIQ
ncbi:hypothetical protein JW877_06935 [bacterium]|nr:hypothetical protein [bacterium]